MSVNGKSSYRILKSDSFGKAAIFLPDTQVDKEEDDITTNNIIHKKTAYKLSEGKLLQTVQ